MLNQHDEIKSLVDSAKMVLMVTEPFYGILLSRMRLQIVDEPNRGLAYVGYSTISINVNKDLPVNFVSLPVDSRVTLIKHELQHVIFGHLDSLVDLDKHVANIAQDAVIHRNLLKENINCLDYFPPGIVRPILDKQGTYIGLTFGSGSNRSDYIIQDFDKLDWYAIYLAIIPEMEKREEIVEYDFNDVELGLPSLKDKEEFEEALIQAAEMEWGNLPASIQSRIKQLREPEISWNSYLYNLIRTEISKTDYTWIADSRFSHITLMTPQFKNESIKDVYLAMDTSGSMSQKDIDDGISEFKHLRETIDFRLSFVQCDAKVQDVQTYEKYEEPEWERISTLGRGGTDFRPVFELVKEKTSEFDRPALLVYYTDCQGTFPLIKPDFTVIWVTKNLSAKPPFGSIITIK